MKNTNNKENSDNKKSPSNKENSDKKLLNLDRKKMEKFKKSYKNLLAL